LGALLNGEPLRMREVDKDVSFIANTTVKYLVDGVRASEASPNAQKKFAEMSFSIGFYDIWMHCLDCPRVPGAALCCGYPLSRL
jgi:hypothetical protein